MVGEQAARAEATRYNAPALQKGLDVLELLAGEPGGLSVTAIAGRLSRSTGELYRIIQYLEQRGYVDRDRESDRYQLSFRLFQLSHEHPPIRSLSACAVPVLQELATEIGQSCHLAVLDQLRVVIVAQVDSPLPIRYSVRLGASFPVWQTSSGALLCAFLPADEREVMLDRIAQEATQAETAAFAKYVVTVRKQAFERRESRLIAGITNLSLPIFGHSGRLLAAATIPYLAQRGNETSIERAHVALELATDVIGRALGHVPDALTGAA